MSAGRFVYLVWCSILAASCSSPLLPESDPGFVTRILTVDPGPFVENSFALLTFHVNLHPPGEDCGLNVAVTPRTRIVDSRGGKTVQATTSVIEEGALVAVWHGILLDSCPGGTGAEAIERLE